MLCALVGVAALAALCDTFLVSACGEPPSLVFSLPKLITIGPQTAQLIHRKSVVIRAALCHRN
jgi:hypothetical protein